MSLMEAIFSKAPEYDPDTDPLATPDEREGRDLPLHVRQCARRYGDLKKGHVEISAALQSTQRLLVILIVLLLANKAIDISFFTGLLSP